MRDYNNYENQSWQNNNNDMTALPENPVVTMAYVPFQALETTYEIYDALNNGTLFPELDKPLLVIEDNHNNYYHTRGMRNNDR